MSRPVMEAALLDAWRLTICSSGATYRFTRPEAASELCEEHGLKGPTPGEVERLRGERMLRGHGWKVVHAPISDVEFLDLPPG